MPRRHAVNAPRSTRPAATLAMVLAAVVAASIAACSSKPYSGPDTGPLPPPPPVRAAKWSLVWADEFDGATIDPANWVVVDGAVNVNNELEYYSPAQVSIENGALVLKSDRQAVGGRQYVSGEVRSGTKRTVTRGNAIEWRTQIPSGKGIWPANWLVNTPCDGLNGCGSNWPPEIDVLEVKGSAPATNIMTHWWGSYPGQQLQTTTWTSSQSLADAYHTYRLEWYRDSILWLVDGTTRAKHTANVTDGQLQIVMNTAVGGNFDGAPDASTVFPQYHRVDYVRVYRDTANSYP
ncbi:MAG: glycoside hydrolase family 16 protein [Gemmatimonadaceae bacterium]|nr:glycoside hydrolase family 16 protein [Gemmatimonadaceae bacterium]